MNFWLIFFTGLTTGGLSCLAMQGGLLASVIANQKNVEHDKLQHINTHSKTGKKLKNNFSLKSLDELDWLPVGMFLLAKLITHTLFGFVLGWLGSTITLSLELRLIFQTFTGLFMLATAMNLLNVHPIFRYVVFQPPKFVQRMVRNSSKSKALFAPALLGVLTIFVPCGVTQAMEVLAINTGDPWQGALILFSFVLGTSPLFALLGVATAKLSEGWYKQFTRFAAIALLVMAIYGLNGVLIVINSPITVNKLVYPVTYFFSEERFSQYNETVQTVNGVQKVSISILNEGYQPRYIKVKAGMPVELTLESKDTYTCALSFVLKEFGIKTFLEATDRQQFVFTPQKKGKYTYTCSMGMYTGILEVV